MENNKTKKPEVKELKVIDCEILAEFIENFNKIKSENTKIRIMLLVKDLIKLQKK